MQIIPVNAIDLRRLRGMVADNDAATAIIDSILARWSSSIDSGRPVVPPSLFDCAVPRRIL